MNPGAHYWAVTYSQLGLGLAYTHAPWLMQVVGRRACACSSTCSRAACHYNTNFLSIGWRKKKSNTTVAHNRSCNAPKMSLIYFFVSAFTARISYLQCGLTLSIYNILDILPSSAIHHIQRSATLWISTLQGLLSHTTSFRFARVIPVSSFIVSLSYIH